MTATISINEMELSPGSTVSIHNLSWQDFESILTGLGEKRNTRIAYYRGTLEILRFWPRNKWRSIQANNVTIRVGVCPAKQGQRKIAAIGVLNPGSSGDVRVSPARSVATSCSWALVRR